MKKYFLLFILALFLAVVTRFYLLGQAPAGLYLDETAQGYNAYSILKTGRDEFGMPFPVLFRSFVDFKTPVYIYLIVPFIPLFGLTAFTVRFPSFLAGIATIPVLFLLVRRLTKDKRQGLFLASVSSLLLAISPWHVLFSRTDFESNVALFLFLSAVYLFYLGLKKPLFLILSAIIFATALPAYHAERLLVPAAILFFLVRFGKIILDRRHLQFSLLSLLLALLITLPTLLVIRTPGFLARVSALNPDSKPPGIIAAGHPLDLLINNASFLHLKEFLALYLAYFSPRNLFFLGDNDQRVSFPELAPFFFWQLPLYLYGLYLILKRKDLGEIRNLTLFMLFVSPLPAALTRDPFTTIRALPLVIPVTIVISLSLYEIWRKVKTKRQKILTAAIFALLIIYSLAKVYSSAIILNEYFRAPSWGYGWKEVVGVINSKTKPNLPIVIDDSRTGPYSKILFYLRYDPASYQRENFEVTLNEYYTNMHRVAEKKIGRITIRNINWKPDLAVEQYLIGDYLAISEQQIVNNHLSLIAEIKYPDGSVAFRIVKTQPKYPN